MSDPAMPQTPAAAPLTRSAPPDDEPTREKLSTRTIRGGLWTVGSYAVVSFIRLGSNLVLTWLLAAELFGVMLIVNTIMTGIRLFSDVGIGPALIAHPRGTQESFLRTAFTTQVLRGVAIWLAACAIALPAAHYYVQHQGEAYRPLLYLLPIAGFVAVPEGFRSTAIFRLQRSLRFAQQSMLDVIEIVVTTTGMITWALLAPSIWALVIPPLIGSASSVVASHFLMRDRRDRLGWDASAAKDLMSIGRWIFISTVLTFLAGQFDRLMFGGYIDVQRLGIYSVAIGLSLIPTLAVLKVGGSVLFPTFSRVADDPARFASVYRRARTMLLTIGALIVSGMIACGPFAVNALYKPTFSPAGWMLQLLAIGVWFQIVDATNVAALLAQRRPRWLALGNLTKVLLMIVLVPVVYRKFEGNALAAAIIALGVADAARAVVSTIGVMRLGVARRTFLPDLFYPAMIVGISLLGLALARWLAPQLGPVIPDSRLGRLLFGGSLATMAGLLVLAIWGPLCAWQWEQSRRPYLPPADASLDTNRV